MTRHGRTLLLLVLLAAAGGARAFEINGLALGAPEAAVRKAFPNAHCRALEWQSSAAQRRCDDSRHRFAGRTVRVTLFLKDGALQAFDVRFTSLEHEAIAAQLRKLYGKPGVDEKEILRHREKADRTILKLLWDKGDQHAAYTAQIDRKGSLLSVWRGEFQADIYRVR